MFGKHITAVPAPTKATITAAAKPANTFSIVERNENESVCLSMCISSGQLLSGEAHDGDRCPRRLSTRRHSLVCQAVGRASARLLHSFLVSARSARSSPSVTLPRPDVIHPCFFQVCRYL